jgi:hypothetical protein
MGVLHKVPTGLSTQDVAGEVDGVDWRDQHVHVPFEVALLLANGNTPHVGPANSAVNTELFPTAKPTRNLIDLAAAREVRLVAMVTALGNLATAAIKLQYTASQDAATWAGTDAGVSLVLGSGTAGVLRDSGWQPLAAGAQVDSCRVAAVISAAFGSTGPSLGSLTAFFR